MSDADREPTGVPVVGKHRGLSGSELRDARDRARPWWGRLLGVASTALVAGSFVWFVDEGDGLGRQVLGFAVALAVVVPLWGALAWFETSWHARNDRRRDAAERGPGPDPDTHVTTP